MTRRLATLTLAAVLAVGIPATADAGVNQPTTLVPADSSVTITVDAGAVFWFGWSDGAHGSDWRNIPLPDCGTAAPLVTFTNSSSRGVLTKHYTDPPEGRIEVKGTSTALTATADC